MIGRADIEGSKSNVAMSACAVTQASYACGVCVCGGGGGGGWGGGRGGGGGGGGGGVLLHMSPWIENGMSFSNDNLLPFLHIIS